MKELKFNTRHQNNEGISIESKESRYLKMSLEDFVKYNPKFDIASVEFLRESYTSRKYSLLTDYILRNFTLKEVYIIFCENQTCFLLTDGLISESKQESIESINENPELTTQEKKRLKKKVWDMPKILYGLVHELIHVSGLFYDEDIECIAYPSLSSMINT